MKIIINFIFLSTLVASGNGYACSCPSWQPTFSLVTKMSPVIVRARVLGYEKDSLLPFPTNMKIEVIDSLKNAEDKEKILVRGDDGMSCMPYVSNFPVGTEWIFALTENFSKDTQHTDVRQFSINGCGDYWFQIQDGKVSGELRGRGMNDSMTLEDFYRLYSLKNSPGNQEIKLEAPRKSESGGASVPFIKITEKRKSAAKFALIRAQFLPLFLSRCGHFSEEANRRAEQIWTNWQDRNYLFVWSSWGLKNYVQRQIDLNEGNDRSNPFDDKFSWDVRHKIDGMMAGLKPKGVLDKKMCNKWFSNFEDVKNDLGVSNEFGGELREILDFYTRLTEFEAKNSAAH